MYVYIQSESGLWTVGFYSPDGKWNPESDHSSKEEAANRIHWLNGGEIEPVVIQQKDSVPVFIPVLRPGERVNVAFEDRCPVCGGYRGDPPGTGCPKGSHYGAEQSFSIPTPSLKRFLSQSEQHGSDSEVQ